MDDSCWGTIDGEIFVVTVDGYMLSEPEFDEIEEVLSQNPHLSYEQAQAFVDHINGDVVESFDLDRLKKLAGMK